VPEVKLEVSGAQDAASIKMLSTSASKWTALQIGRTSVDVDIAIAGASAQFVPNSVAGDLIIRTASTKQIFTTDNGTTANLTITAAGLVGIGPTTPTYQFDVANSSSGLTFRAYDQTAGGTTKAVIRAGAGQSGNLFEVQNNAGTAESWITSTGGQIASGSFSVDSGAGYIQFAARSLFRSPSDGVLTIKNNAETDFNRLQFGGTTSSFPALKRSTTTLQARLADDSADTDIQASYAILSQTTPSASADACTQGRVWADANYFYACTATGVIKRVAIATW